jgi:hypothetical protein
LASARLGPNVAQILGSATKREHLFAQSSSWLY